MKKKQRMLRSITALLLCAAMVLPLAGCKETEEEQTTVETIHPDAALEQAIPAGNQLSADAVYQILDADGEAYGNYTFYAARIDADALTDDIDLTDIVENCVVCQPITTAEPQAIDLDAGVYAVAFVDNANHENRAIRIIWVKESGGADALTVETDWETEYVPNVTFSASIGEINGTIYAARESYYQVSQDGSYQSRDIPTCRLLPVEISEYNHMISSFCYYDGYVYYIESEQGSSDYSTWLYRCKPDWTEKELLAEMIFEYIELGAGIIEWTESSIQGDRSFVIDHGVLYYGTTAIDLETMKKFTAQTPTYAIYDNGQIYEGTHMYDLGYDMVIYNDVVFFVDENHNLYKQVDKDKELLATHAYLDGGCTSEYLYYAEYDWETAQDVKLYRVSLETGEKEFVDSRMPAGGGGPYFCW